MRKSQRMSSFSSDGYSFIFSHPFLYPRDLSPKPTNETMVDRATTPLLLQLQTSLRGLFCSHTNTLGFPESFSESSSSFSKFLSKNRAPLFIRKSQLQDKLNFVLLG